MSLSASHVPSPLTHSRPGDLESLRARHLELFKKTLTYSLWEEPGMPIDIVGSGFGFPIAPLTRWAQAFLQLFRFKLTYCRPGEDARREGKTWPAQAFTMVGMERLNQLQACVETALKESVPGDFIETGVWRGGSSIFMRAILDAYGDARRKVWVADSFAGLPPPNASQYPADKGDIHYKLKFDAVSLETVQSNFRKFGLLDENVVFLKGWFKDTLPSAPIGPISIMRLDGDMYESTMQALEALYPKLSPRGFCIIDDYGLARCKQAVDDFRQKNSIHAPIQKTDWTGIFWRK